MTRIPGTCARYLIRDRVLYIFCRGTSKRHDKWYRNLLVRRTRWRGYRVNRADWQEALLVLGHLWDTSRWDSVEIMGFSRGAGPAAILALQWPDAYLQLAAPKRLGCRGLVKHLRGRMKVTAKRFDVIPLLPPWYAGWRCKWYDYMWPWDAHAESARRAAWWRHEIGG